MLFFKTGPARPVFSRFALEALHLKFAQKEAPGFEFGEDRKYLTSLLKNGIKKGSFQKGWFLEKKSGKLFENRIKFCSKGAKL